VPEHRHFAISSSTGRAPASTSRLASTCIGTSATGSPSYSVLWEEIVKRDLEIELLDRPKYLRSNLIHGVRELPVQIH